MWTKVCLDDSCYDCYVQVTHREKGEVMVIKELFKFDEEAQKKFLHEVGEFTNLSLALVAAVISPTSLLCLGAQGTLLKFEFMFAVMLAWLQLFTVLAALALI